MVVRTVDPVFLGLKMEASSMVCIHTNSMNRLKMKKNLVGGFDAINVEC